MTAERIVIATIGSLGDLYPFIAIAKALRARGAEVVLALPIEAIAWSGRSQP